MIFAKPWADALIVLLVILLFFGPKRLPALGRSLGEGMREFKDSITGKSKSDEGELPSGAESAAQRPAPPVVPTEPTATQPPPAPPVVPTEPTATQPPPAPPAPPEAAAPPVGSSESRS